MTSPAPCQILRGYRLCNDMWQAKTGLIHQYYWKPLRPGLLGWQSVVQCMWQRLQTQNWVSVSCLLSQILCVGLAGFSLSGCSHNKVMSSSESLASLVPCHWLSVGHLLRKKCKGVVWRCIIFCWSPSLHFCNQTSNWVYMNASLVMRHCLLELFLWWSIWQALWERPCI